MSRQPRAMVPARRPTITLRSQQAEPDEIIIEEDLCFDIGGGHMPVSRRIPDASRQVIIRELKAYTVIDGAIQFCFLAFATVVSVTALVCVLGAIYAIARYT